VFVIDRRKEIEVVFGLLNRHCVSGARQVGKATLARYVEK